MPDAISGTKSYFMLKKVLMAALFAAFISGSAIADNGQNNERIVREIQIMEGFNKIIINGNANVVLVEEKSMIATIEDEAADENSTTITSQNGILTVQVVHNRNGRPVIKIPVRQLQVLEVNGDGNVNSVSSLLMSENLAVFINGECKIALRTTGNISVDAADGFECVYLKNDKIRILRETK